MYKDKTVRADINSGKVEQNDKVDVWDGKSASSSLEGKGTEQEPYLIKSGNDLQYINNQVAGKANITGTNADNTKNGENISANSAYYRLETNIKMNDITNFEKWNDTDFDKSSLNKWTPIGKEPGNALSFFGTFDGNGYEISGLYVEENGELDCGFIAALYGENACIQNLKITNSLVIAKSIVGGIAGQCTDGKIKNCYFSGCVQGTSSEVGGIVGSCYNSKMEEKISGCINDGKIQGNFNVGGIVGQASKNIIYNCTNNGTILGTSKTPGITGEANNEIIKSCINNGNIEGMEDTSTYSYFAGIIGSAYNVSVEECENNGNISFAKMDNTFYQIGSIIGLLSVYQDDIRLSNLTNNGNVTTGNQAQLGQIVGAIYCRNGEKVKITNITNNGTVKFENGNIPENIGVLEEE